MPLRRPCRRLEAVIRLPGSKLRKEIFLNQMWGSCIASNRELFKRHVGGWVGPCFAEKEGAYLILKENLPGALVANPIGRKTYVSAPKRYRVCHNSDKVCQNEGWKLAQKARPSHFGSAEKPLFYRRILGMRQRAERPVTELNKCDCDIIIFHFCVTFMTQPNITKLVTLKVRREEAGSKSRFFLPISAIIPAERVRT